MMTQKLVGPMKLKKRIAPKKSSMLLVFIQCLSLLVTQTGLAEVTAEAATAEAEIRVLRSPYMPLRMMELGTSGRGSHVVLDTPEVLVRGPVTYGNPEDEIETREEITDPVPSAKPTTVAPNCPVPLEPQLGSGTTFVELNKINHNLCPRAGPGVTQASFCRCVAQQTQQAIEEGCSDCLYPAVQEQDLRVLGNTMMQYVRFSKIMNLRRLYYETAQEIAIATTYRFLSADMNSLASEPCYPGNLSALKDRVIAGGKCTQADINDMDDFFNSFNTECSSGPNPTCSAFQNTEGERVVDRRNQLDMFNQNFATQFIDHYNHDIALSRTNERENLNSPHRASLEGLLQNPIDTDLNQSFYQAMFTLFQNANGAEPTYPQRGDPLLNDIAHEPLFTSLIRPYVKNQWPMRDRERAYTPEGLTRILQSWVEMARSTGQTFTSVTDFSVFVNNNIKRFYTTNSNPRSIPVRCNQIQQELEDFCQLGKRETFNIGVHIGRTEDPREYDTIAQSLVSGHFNNSNGSEDINNLSNFYIGRTHQMMCHMTAGMTGIFTSDALSYLRDTEIFGRLDTSEQATAVDAMLAGSALDGGEALVAAVGGTAGIVMVAGMTQERKNQENYRQKAGESEYFTNHESAGFSNSIDSEVQNASSSYAGADGMVDPVTTAASEIVSGRAATTAEVPYDSSYVSSAPKVSTGSVDLRGPASVSGSTSDDDDEERAAAAARVADANARTSDDLRRQIEQLRQQLAAKQSEIAALASQRAEAASAGTSTTEIDAQILERQRQLAELERDLLERRTSLARLSAPTAPVAPRTSTSATVSSGGLTSSAPVVAAAPAARPAGGSTGGGVAPTPVVTSSSSSGTIGLTSSTSTGTGGANLGSLGIITNYSGPQLTLNGESFNSGNRMLIPVSVLNTATDERLDEIFRAVGGSVVYVLFPDNTVREYQGSRTTEGRIVFLPYDGTTPVDEGRGVASIAPGETTEGDAPVEPTEREFVHEDVGAAIDQNRE